MNDQEANRGEMTPQASTEDVRTRSRTDGSGGIPVREALERQDTSAPCPDRRYPTPLNPGPFLTRNCQLRNHRAGLYREWNFYRREVGNSWPKVTRGGSS